MRQIIVPILIVLLLVVAGCVEIRNEPQPEQQEQTSNIEPVQEEVVQQVPEPEPLTCEQWAESLVVKKVTVLEGEARCERALTGTWADGTAMVATNDRVEYRGGANKNFQMVKGSKLGEDVNKYYAKTFSGELLVFKYEKTTIESGTVTSVATFEIRPLSYTRVESSMKEAEEEGIGCVTYDYTFDDYDALSCSSSS